MPNDDAAPSSQREQTDESLRAEREAASGATAQRLAAIDRTADAVIKRARVRADQLLAAARIAGDSRSAQSQQILEQQRLQAARELDNERARADVTLRQERASFVERGMLERSDTDKDLRSERVYADNTLATRDEFLGMVSHDLRSMLQVLLGHAELIGLAPPQGGHSSPIIEHLASIGQAGSRMDRLVGDLVDLASVSAGCFALAREVLEPDALLGEALDAFLPLARASEIELSLELCQPSCLAVFDPARILQVVSNLLSNAIKFTPPGGRVVLRAWVVDGALRFSVSDTGIGIAQDKLDAVFERFFRVHEQTQPGAGLGLYISRCIVLGHGGRIWVESTPETGSTFSFTVPLFSLEGTPGC